MTLLRLLFQTVVLAVGQLWASKVRALLTTLGIVIGIASVVGTIAATEGLRASILSEFATVGANRVWVFPRRPQNQASRFSQSQIRMSLAEADGLMTACPSLLRLTPIKQFVAPVTNGEKTQQNVSISGVRPAWHLIEGRSVLQGREFSAIDEAERRFVCLINDKAIEEMALDRSPTGQFLLVDGKRFLIVGVVETKSVSPTFGGQEAKSEVFIPFATADMLKPFPFYGLYVAAQTKTPELFEDAKAEITFFMRKSRKLLPDDPDTFGVEAIEQYVSQFKRISSLIALGASGIVGISLLVGGIGIMNIMLVSVSERTREIGLRKAVGARPAVILIQFLVEAVVLCIAGALIGLAIGYSMVWGLTNIPGFPLDKASIPAWAAALSIGFATITGITFGMFPAIKASRLNPIDALRHE